VTSDVTRYVIGPDVVLHLAGDSVKVPAEHRLVAPNLLKSQVLSLLYRAVRRGEVAKKEADRQLNYLRGLKIRLLSDRVSQATAWRIADQLGWPDTYEAEYLAVTQLQADAFVTLDKRLADAVKGVVTLAPVEVLLP
jgi:predicted nucleic acid-binding protein